MIARALLAAAAVLVASFTQGSTALAHSAGQPGPGCMNCHGSGDYDIEVTTSPSSFAPGAEVDVTVTITQPSGDNAGVFVAANEGTLGAVGGQGLAAVPAGLTHTSPKAISGGDVSFTFAWTAPSEPGAVRFDVSTLVGNGNGSSSGDQGNHGYFDFVYGCSPATYYRDFDGDGYGTSELTLVHCDTAAPAGYASEGGDCNDGKEGIYPGAIEYCNQKDDDCDGEIDDDAIPVTLYPDADGDGYYGNEEFASGETITGCVPTPGYGAEPGDCQPDDLAINPGVVEVCNLIDDNCDTRVDEYVRPRCGEGWCEREASSCDPATCYPGDPVEEECNLLDDNCDGVVDEGSLCPEGQSCVAAVCTDPPVSKPPEAEDESGCTSSPVSGRSTLIAWLLAAIAISAAYRTRSGSGRA